MDKRMEFLPSKLALQNLCMDFPGNSAAAAVVFLLFLLPAGAEYSDECILHRRADLRA